jgi:serine protease
MGKSVLAPRLVVPILALLAASSSFILRAQSTNQPDVEGPPGGVRLLEPGQPYAQIHSTREAMERYRAAHGNGSGSATTTKNLSYHGGTSGIGVETAPKVYLVLWGSQWATDPSGEEAILENFFNNVGGSSWLNSVTQYCQAVTSGTVLCNGVGTPAGNQPGILAGLWYDNSSQAPSRPTQTQLGAEAVKAAQHFGNTSSSLNASVQYVIATAHNNNAGGFGRQYCAWHSSTSSLSTGRIAYTNLPYMTDAGASCGANFNGLGPMAGITIVEGHELAETITDQFPSTGWLDGSGAENGDKCAWISSGTGASANVALNSTTTVPVQSLWSNATGSCVLSY